MKKTKLALFQSVVSLLLCISMLAGTTFAWFTDSVTSANNIIKSGKLDVEMFWADGTQDPETVTWTDASTGAIFDYSLWEPGYTEVRHIKIANEGNLALKYQLHIQANGTVSKLSDVIDVYFLDPAKQVSARTELTEDMKVGTLTQVLAGMPGNASGSLKADEIDTVTIALKMQETAGNEYQNLSIGSDFKVILLATQEQFESDSFGTDYDKDATFDFPENTISVNVSGDVSVADGKVTEATTLDGGTASAVIPAGVQMAEGNSKLTLTISEMAKSGANLTLSENEAMRPLNIHVEGVSKDNTVPMEIAISEVAAKGLNEGNLKLYHVENGVSNQMEMVDTFTAHNQFKYDPATGEVTVYMATFSEVALVADTENAWEGKFNYTWYDASKTELTIANADQLAAFGAIVGGMNGQTQDSFAGKTVKLISDVNLGDAEKENNPDLIFYPIGYNCSDGKYERTGVAVTTGFYNFSGTFDGQGHTIANFYQNTWEMKGDNNYYDATLQYYRDGMGLFGKVYGGTVKNLTVDNFKSDGEYTTTGVIAAYADGATFENIAITKCNPRVYNIGNGGIVGCVGWYAKEAGLKTTFKNITVDNSNKISALWGSYDVACGGIVGQYYPTSGQSSAGTPANGGIHFDNCHVSAQIDVYNDVCANYQYYAYRYAGMLIGSVRENVTIDGHSYPKMDGITASGCTVHFGTWNDYYYCEIIDNTTASYTHDYQMSRLTEIKAINGTTITYLDGKTETVPTSGRANYVIVDYSKGHGTENATCYHFKDGKVWNHEDGGKETINGVEVLKEDKQHIYLEFNNLVTGYGWGVTTKVVGELEGVTILDREEGKSVEKFKSKFTGDFLYRVGNKNTVSVGSLFAAKDGATINSSGVVVTIDKVDENSNVSGTFTANTTDWTKGTIQFSGTGVVKVTIQDYNFCTPTVLYLEVVDAVNATGATSATSNNVVLLNDCGFSSLEVSGGYTLYGNGFTMTCDSDSAALNTGYEFVAVDNGTLDNVQIICPNFDDAVLYSSNMTESGNRSETTDKTRYFNVKSAVEVTGNSQILNSRISGGRAALNVVGGNVVVDNSRIEGGAVASVLVGSANSLTLRDVTLVQKPTASTYDSNKTLMGFSVLFICDANGDAAPVALEGTLVQNAWVDENDKKYVPSAGQSIISTVLGKTEYLHDIDGDGTKESLNLGFAYMPESLTSKVNATTITDNRTNKNAVPYDYAEVSVLSGKTYVYSYKNTNGTGDSFKNESEYKPNAQGDIITVTYSDTADGLETGKSFGTDGWVYELNVDLDKLSGYALDFSKLSMTVNGTTVTDFKVNGSAKPTSPVAVTAGGTTYTLTTTVNDKEYTVTYKVTGTETSKESPTLVGTPSYGVGFGVANSYNGDWSGAAPVLDGITVKYWSVAESAYKEFALSSITFAKTGKQNGSNNYWEYTHANNDFTLKLTNTVAMHDKSQTFGIPVAGKDGKLYFTIAGTGGFVGNGTSSRSITIKYEFTDNNGGETLTFSNTWNIAQDETNQYNYNSFVNDGTLTQLEKSSGGSITECITPETLITLANGSQVRVDSLTGNEKLLVWNLETGKYDTAPIVFVDTDEQMEYEIIHLYFSDGSDVKVISEHGFFGLDLGKYVYIDADNYSDYIGHRFVTEGSIRSNSWNVVTLKNVVLEKEVTTAWSPVTFEHLCYYTNGVLSMPGGIEGLFNIFEVDTKTMRYDAKLMQKDIDTYGLLTLEDFGGLITQEAFDAFNGAYLKVAMGKGLLTWEDIAYMAERYIPLMK